ncbi:MAG TPA: MobF family relaxase [Propionibacteriaceae bacterium]
MSIHKLTAGSGYDYLTRQVAALDATEKGHVGLASYYTERGETPGVWIGSGMAGIDGLAAGDVVTAEQMQALFGSGRHPLAAQRQAALQGPNLTEADYQEVMQLGAPFKLYPNDISPFRLEVAKRIAAANIADGLPGDWPISPADRARIRSEVAREMYRAEQGRDPANARELAGAIARFSRPQTRAVAGYDLTFSPVKSVSALWAVADSSVAVIIERAHRAAVADALKFIETKALFTRTGTNGVRQVDVRGLVATAFTHRDSRAGDPDLHTHVAVANKVQTLDGRWLSVDGRVLFKATVSASETYNTALERHLADTLGVRFVERPNPDVRLRPVREIAGVNPQLNERWSARRAAIDTRRLELAAHFQAAHGRPATPIEMLQLAQQANLETRDAKHEPRTLAEQRATWQTEAAQVLGGPAAIRAMVHTALNPSVADSPAIDAGAMNRAVDRVLAVMESSRSTWQMWHVRAEAHRQIRALCPAADQVGPLVELVTNQVLQDRSVSLARPSDGVDEPALLRRSDGASVYSVAGADLYTSTTILDAESRLVAAAGRTDGHTISRSSVDLALLEATANGGTLNAGQVALVRDMCTSGARLQLAIAPAGSGKTTAMQALTRAWTAGSGTVLGLAPSASAAAQLRDQTGAHTDTLAKLTWSIDHDQLPDWARNIGRRTLVVIDEAGMADTLSLDTAVSFITGRGGSVRLVGDDQQLAAIGAGGVLRDIDASHGALRLTELLRFTDPAEAAASLALRDGRPEALGFYFDQQRVTVGDLAGLTEDVFTGWQNDRDQGLDSIMLAPTRNLAAELNHRARSHRLDQSMRPRQVARPLRQREVTLADGNQASVGDTVITRSNNRQLRVSGTDWVKNGDRWTVTAVAPDGGLQARHTSHGRTVRLPSHYVATSVELGYATTVHTAQGVTVDTMHGLASGEETRQLLYTMLTRGRIHNHLYLHVAGDGDPHTVIRSEHLHPLTATDVLEQILANDQTTPSATTLQREQHDPALRLGDAAAQYVDALYGAAEDVLGHVTVEALERSAEQVVPGLTADTAWPALRAHLILLAANGDDALTGLAAAVNIRGLDSADDKAAVLDWRLDDTGLRNCGPGPLPWIPGIPTALRDHPLWGPYLAGRAELVTQLANQIRDHVRAGADRPALAHHGPPAAAPIEVITQVSVWRAATQVQPTDLRPTGPAQRQQAAQAWQHHLDQALTAGWQPALTRWGPLIQNVSPSIMTDRFLPVLADRLDALDRAGIDARSALHTAVTEGPLPDDHGGAALWWRITRHLPAPVVQDAEGHPALSATPDRPLETPKDHSSWSTVPARPQSSLDRRRREQLADRGHAAQNRRREQQQPRR